MYAADIYRNYVPTKFSELANTSDAVSALIEMSRSNSFPRILLLHGEHGTGKSTITRMLVYALNCTGGGDKPCYKCEACQMISENIDMYLENLNASDNRKIDDIRDLIDRFNEPTLLGLKRLFVLNEAEQITKDAQKALKDPFDQLSDDTYVVITTNDITKIIKELVDRADVYGFHGLLLDEAIKFLETVAKKMSIANLKSPAINKILKSSDGMKPRSILNSLNKFMIGGENALITLEEGEDDKVVWEFINKLIKGPNDSSYTFGEMKSAITYIVETFTVEKFRIVFLGRLKNILLNDYANGKLPKSVNREFMLCRYSTFTDIMMPELSVTAPIADAVHRIWNMILEVKKYHRSLKADQE